MMRLPGGAEMLPKLRNSSDAAMRVACKELLQSQQSERKSLQTIAEDGEEVDEV